MKAFIISLCALVTIVGTTVGSSIYIGKVTNELDGMVSELAPNDETKFQKAKAYWEKNEHFICIFVSHKDIDNVNIAFKVLEEKFQNDDGGGFYEYSALLEKYIEEIANKERFHIDNII